MSKKSLSLWSGVMVAAFLALEASGITTCLVQEAEAACDRFATPDINCPDDFFYEECSDVRSAAFQEPGFKQKNGYDRFCSGDTYVMVNGTCEIQSSYSTPVRCYEAVGEFCTGMLIIQ